MKSFIKSVQNVTHKRTFHVTVLLNVRPVIELEQGTVFCCVDSTQLGGLSIMVKAPCSIVLLLLLLSSSSSSSLALITSWQ